VIRVSLATLAASVLLATPAHGVLVYQRGTDEDRNAPIVAARNDGTYTRVVAGGNHPQVSPTGKRVAYFEKHGDREDLYVVGNRGRHRQLQVRDSWGTAPVAWSPDDRYLIVSSFGSPGAFIVDRRERRTKHIAVGGGEFWGGSFAPGSNHELVMCGVFERDAVLVFRDLATGARRRVAWGCTPEWGPHGLAFEDSGRLLLLKHLGEERETLLRRESRAVAWSADGKRLLAFETSSFAVQPIFIDLAPRRMRRLEYSLVPKDLSRDGKEILGEAGGSVVVRKPGGNIRVVASHATTPSWTK
jgi:dipeptidyl aminopeptidase/acylaminoacyl peptidase